MMNNKKLLELHPELLRAVGYPETSVGWADILAELFEVMEREIAALPPEERERVHPLQIKEKFGGLRVYMAGTTEGIQKAIKAAEYKAERTCETCGKPGMARPGGWVVTLCDEHAAMTLMERRKLTEREP
jgi:hypothetical protein